MPFAKTSQVNLRFCLFEFVFFVEGSTNKDSISACLNCFFGPTYMPSPFMNRLNLRVQEGVNALGIPLFDRKNARKVLPGYGRVLVVLPAQRADLQWSPVKRNALRIPL